MCAPGATPRKRPGRRAPGHDAGDVRAVAVEVTAGPADAIDEVHVYRDAASAAGPFP